MLKTRKAPTSLGKQGRTFWSSVLKEYEFEKSHDYELLAQACQCIDRLESCRVAILSDGLFQKDRYGRSVEHDGAKNERSQKKLFLSICRELGLTLVRQETQKRKLY